MIKSNGNLGAFFSRPIAAVLAIVTIAVWVLPVVVRWRATRSVAV